MGVGSGKTMMAIWSLKYFEAAIWKRREQHSHLLDEQYRWFCSRSLMCSTSFSDGSFSAFLRNAKPLHYSDLKMSLNERDSVWEATILSRLAASDETALVDVLKQCGPTIVGRLKSKFSTARLSQEDYEEILSTTLYRLWRNHRKLKSDQWQPWMFAVARNAAIELLRCRSRRISEVPLDEQSESLLTV